MLAVSDVFEKIRSSDVELGAVVEIIAIEVAGIEERDELGVPGQIGIGTKVGGDFLGLILQDRGAQCQERVVVLHSETQSVFKSYVCGRICVLRGSERRGRRASRR